MFDIENQKKLFHLEECSGSQKAVRTFLNLFSLIFLIFITKNLKKVVQTVSINFFIIHNELKGFSEEPGQ